MTTSWRYHFNVKRRHGRDMSISILKSAVCTVSRGIVESFEHADSIQGLISIALAVWIAVAEVQGYADHKSIPFFIVARAILGPWVWSFVFLFMGIITTIGYFHRPARKEVSLLCLFLWLMIGITWWQKMEFFTIIPVLSLVEAFGYGARYLLTPCRTMRV